MHRHAGPISIGAVLVAFLPSSCSPTSRNSECSESFDQGCNLDCFLQVSCGTALMGCSFHLRRAVPCKEHHLRLRRDRLDGGDEMQPLHAPAQPQIKNCQIEPLGLQPTLRLCPCGRGVYVAPT